MQGFDVNRFVRDRTPVWQELEAALQLASADGIRGLGIEGARRLGKLYRSVSNDLIRARTELVDAAVVDYLNDLVARTYAVLYAGAHRRRYRLWRFLSHTFPRLVREEWKATAIAALVFAVGAAIGAHGTASDRASRSVLIPEQHQAWSPDERVSRDESAGPAGGHEAVAFSSFLFTNNTRVSFLVFALGITAGLGTIAVLFANGVPLGALAVQYHAAGQGLFFWAWILPHGVPELFEVFLAGGSGLILARGMLFPGRRTRREALVHEARRAVQLVLGGMPILVVAGVIEGTISQIHEPTVPYWVKLVFAGLVTAGLAAYIGLAGRNGSAVGDAESLGDAESAATETQSPR